MAERRHGEHAIDEDDSRATPPATPARLRTGAGNTAIARALGTGAAPPLGEMAGAGNAAIAGIMRAGAGVMRDGGAESGVLDPSVASAIDAARGGGSPLAGPVRADMEHHLSADLGAVRVHTGPEAVALNRAVSARAFTTGADVFLSEGGTPDRELLAHELTHVVQSTAAPGRISHPNDPAEVEARAVARQVAASPTATEQASGPPTVERLAIVPAVTGAAGVQRERTKAVAAAPTFNLFVTPGGQAGGVAREIGAITTVFKGDRARVRVRFPAAAKDTAAPELMGLDDSMVLNSSAWVSERVFEWELTFVTVGYRSVAFTVTDGGERVTNFENFTVVADLQDFSLACTQALAVLNGRYARAAGQISKAASAFRQAFAEQDADLKDVEADEAMIDNLIWGAVFAAAGGLAGGALGGWLKKVKDGAFKNSDWLIDTAKDTGKFVVRSADRLRGGHGHGAPKTAGDSTAPNAQQIGRPNGARKASGQDPLEFLTSLGMDLGDEGTQLFAQLAIVIQEARWARDANSAADFVDDPVAIVNSGKELEDITSKLPSDKKDYLKQLWGTWIGAYAWKASSSGSASSNVGRKLRKKIDKAAKACNETTDQWIAEFGPSLKVQKDDESEDLAQQAAERRSMRR